MTINNFSVMVFSKYWPKKGQNLRGLVETSFNTWEVPFKGNFCWKTMEEYMLLVMFLENAGFVGEDVAGMNSAMVLNMP